MRLRGELCDLPQDDEDEDQDERFEGELDEQFALRNNREIMEDEVAALEQLLGMAVKRDKKLMELLRLTDHIAKESGAATRRRCSSSPNTGKRKATWFASWRRSTAKARSWSSMGT